MNRNALISSVTTPRPPGGHQRLPVADTKEHSPALCVDGVCGGVCDVVNHAGFTPGLAPTTTGHCVGRGTDGEGRPVPPPPQHHSLVLRPSGQQKRSPRGTGSQAFINIKEEQKKVEVGIAQS